MVFPQSQIKTLNPWTGKEWRILFSFHRDWLKTIQLPAAGFSEVKSIKQHSGFHFLTFIYSLSFLISLWSVNLYITPQAPEDAWEKGKEHTGKIKVQSSLNTTQLHFYVFMANLGPWYFKITKCLRCILLKHLNLQIFNLQQILEHKETNKLILVISIFTYLLEDKA